VLGRAGFLFASSLVLAGDMHPDNGDGARAARELFVRSFAPGRPLVCGRQVHGTAISHLKESVPALLDGIDGHYVPRGLDLLAGVFTADCLGLCLADPVRGDFVLIHSGWRGTAAEMPVLALRELEARGSNPADILVAFAPSIKSCCYEVGEEFYAHFPDGPFTKRESGLYFDNEGAAMRSLVSRGVLPERIHPSPFCTCCDTQGRFYSWRRQAAASGRMLTICAAIDGF
jgi:YfiH family protein